jgi:hypothetical protein
MAAKKPAATDEAAAPEVKKSKVKLLKPLAPYANAVGDTISVELEAERIEYLVKKGFIELA